MGCMSKGRLEALVIVVLIIITIRSVAEYEVRNSDLSLVKNITTEKPPKADDRQHAQSSSDRLGIQHDRRKQVDNTCSKLPRKSLVPESELIRNRIVRYPNHNIVFCQIYKSASTNINRFLNYVLLDKWKTYSSSYDIPLEKLEKVRFSSTSLTNISQPLNSSFKFLFVRDPYQRIFSGYLDKFVFVDSYTWNLIGQKIIKKYRPNADAKSIRCGNNVRFSELVKYIIDGVKSGQLNEHFTPYHENCWPCEMKYNFIGKLETQADDMEYIWKVSNETKEIHGHFPDLYGASMASIDEKVDFIYKYKHLYSGCTNFFEAMQLTWVTLQMRGIIGKNISFPYNDGDTVPREIFRDKSSAQESYLRGAAREFKERLELSEYRTEEEIKMRSFSYHHGSHQ
ncbi:hypothetical protein ScPMuIL_006017 [Solemya velum]